jgi:hypothetical protein
MSTVPSAPIANNNDKIKRQKPVIVSAEQVIEQKESRTNLQSNNELSEDDRKNIDNLIRYQDGIIKTQSEQMLSMIDILERSNKESAIVKANAKKCAEDNLNLKRRLQNEYDSAVKTQLILFGILLILILLLIFWRFYCSADSSSPVKAVVNSTKATQPEPIAVKAPPKPTQAPAPKPVSKPVPTAPPVVVTGALSGKVIDPPRIATPATAPKPVTVRAPARVARNIAPRSRSSFGNRYSL